MKEDSEAALQILTESSSQAGIVKNGPQRFQTRTSTGRVVALLVTAKHQQDSASTDHYTACITLSVNSQCSTGDRGTRSPKSRMGNRPLQHFPHIWAANAWDGVNRWICSVCIYLTLFSSIWSLTLSPLTHSLICTANAVFQSTGLVSCLSLCCSEDFPPAPPNNFHESDFYPYPPSVLSLGPVLTFKLDKLKVITEWKEQG